jgi:hypothetical protein
MSALYDKELTSISRFDKKPDTDLIAALTKNYALVMSNKDASGVACTDKAECATVRENFLKKKLGLTADDSELDGAIQEICKVMSADKKKSRVTFYYLLAKKFKKESVFV